MTKEQIKELKGTTLGKIVAILRHNLEREERDNGIYNVARAALAAFVGRPITKRCATAIEKALNARDGAGKWACRYETYCGLYRVRVMPVTARGYDTAEKGALYPDYDASLTLYLGGSGDGIMRLDNGEPVGGLRCAGFDEASGFAGAAAVKRIEARRALLNDAAKLETLAAAIGRFNAARAALLGDDGFSGGLLNTWDDEAGDRLPDCYAIRRLMAGENDK